VALGLAASLGLVAARFSGTAALLVAAVAALVLAGLLALGTPTLAVTADTLHAGRARIPLAMVADVAALDAGQMRRARGVDLDARAYLCLRGWIGGGVLVRLQDPDDPTPYWLLSSRRPQRLATAVRAGVERSRAGR
jgi:hypothetical protein